MSRTSLIHWIQQALEPSQVQVKVCLRGNNLYLLCEREVCPDATAIAQQLQQILSKPAIAAHLSADATDIHRVVCYGRVTGAAQPAWARAIPLPDLLHQPAIANAGSEVLPSPEKFSTPQYAVVDPGADSDGGGMGQPAGGMSSGVNESDGRETSLPSEVAQSEVTQSEIIFSGIAPSEGQQAQPSQAQPSHPDRLPANGGDGVEAGTAISPAAADRNGGDPSVQALAQQGHPTAIAHHLSQQLAGLGISIRAKLDAVPNPQAASSPSPPPPDTTISDSHGSAAVLQRLLILCESAYAPDPALLADPIAHHLRQLGLTQFRDAVVFGQVRGEQRPEWLVRIDLTPRDAMVREWAGWGDVQAIAVCLNRHLADYGITLTAFLKETTLHLSCVGEAGTAPLQSTVVEAIVPDLQALAPQGIQAAILYGVEESLPAGAAAAEPNADPPADELEDLTEAIPGWVQVVELATAESPQAISTLTLAQQGDLPALTFLLTRLLNPDLEAALATGGIRVQVRHKGDLLHVLAEAPTCPRQDAVAPAVVRCLKPLLIEGVAGLRVYGRRSGQKHPLWSHAVDVSPRQSQRLVAEAQPDFAASDRHVDELLPTSGAIVRWSDLPDDGLGALLRRLYAQTIEQVQRSLMRTQLFVPVTDPGDSSQLVPWQTDLETPATHRWKIALVWVAIGGLFIVQLDWLLGAWLRLSEQQAAVAPEPPATAVVPEAPRAIASPIPLPEMTLNQKPQANGFNQSPFTRPGEDSVVVPPSPDATADPAASASSPPPELPASPWQAKASTLLGTTEYPTFNSRQLNDQIQLYRRYLDVHGAPDVLVVGSSRALRGIDPVALETALAQQGYSGVKVFNFGINGATAQVVDLLVRQLLPQDQLPKLILFADGARAFNSGRQDITFNGIVASAGYQMLLAGNPPIPSAIAQATVPTQAAAPTKPAQPWHQQWNEQLNARLASLSMLYGQRDRLKVKLREQFTAMLPQELTAANVLASSDRLMDTSPAAVASGTNPGTAQDVANQVDINGFLPLSVQFNPLTYYQKYARVVGDYDSDYEAFGVQGVQTEAMQALAQYAQAQQIPLVFVNLPLTQDYLDPVRKDHEMTFQQFMLQLSTQNGFFYRNLGGFLPQPHYFSDPSHLNRYGAYVVSRQLAQDVMIPWQVTRDAP